LFTFRSDFPFSGFLSEYTLRPSLRARTRFYLIDMVVSFVHSATRTSKLPRLAVCFGSEDRNTDWRFFNECSVGLFVDHILRQYSFSLRLAQSREGLEILTTAASPSKLICIRQQLNVTFVTRTTMLPRPVEHVFLKLKLNFKLFEHLYAEHASPSHIPLIPRAASLTEPF
jgi:hypothetical protein